MGAIESFVGFEWHSYRYEEEQHPAVVAFAAALEGAGFERLGVKWEAPPGWERMHSLEFASPQRECFASCAVLAGRPTLHLLTTFLDGSVVATWLGSGTEPVRTRRFVHHNVPGGSPAALLAAHAAEVARQKARGKEVVEDFSAQGRLDATLYLYANPDNPIFMREERTRAFWLSAACDAALMASWLVALLWPVSATYAFALVANASATMALSHWSGARGGSKALAWIATAMAAASTAAAAVRFF